MRTRPNGVAVDDRVGELGDDGGDRDDKRQVEQQLEWGGGPVGLGRVPGAHRGQHDGSVASGMPRGNGGVPGSV
jgi:hypothetical protein